MRCILLVLIITIFISVFFNTVFCADEKKVAAEDALIGSTFKTLAKLFISAQNKDRLMEKLNRMDEQKFQRRYARVYPVIKDAPAIVNHYGFKEKTPKPEVISKIKGMDKKDMLAAVDAIPDKAIARQFKLYLLEKKQSLQKSGSVEQITEIWNRLIGNMGFK